MATLAVDELRAWRAFLVAHSRIVRALDRELIDAESVSLAQYEVLLRLAAAPDHSLRMTRLAEEVVLSPSGVTRMVDQLERRGYVERRVCPTDKRGYLAVLTPAGRAKLRAASKTHVTGIHEHFTARIPAEELGTLSSLLEPLVD